VTRRVSFLSYERRYGIPLSAIDRIIHAVEITPLPKAHEIVRGGINLAGQIVPVVDIRKRFGLAQRGIRLSNQFLVGEAGRLSSALMGDASVGVVERSEEDVMSVQAVLPDMQYLEGIAKMEDGMIPIPDLNKFLFLEEEREIGETLIESFKVLHES
jgi:purine-binding chemotaxis protein CheW